MDILKYKNWMVTLSILVVILAPIRTHEVKRPNKLILDHDGGADDSMAIFMALLYEKYFNGPAVIALTTVHGNTNEQQSFINTQRILDIAERRDVPVYRGSSDSLVISVPRDGYFGIDGLGDNEYEAIKPIAAQARHAALGIIELVNKYPGEITLVAMGPLTNVAMAIRLDPALISKLSHLYVGAGNIYSETMTIAEFNANQDVESYQIVVKNAKPEKVTIVPFSQVIPKNITQFQDWRKNVLGIIPTKVMAAQNSFERVLWQKENGWLMDPIVVGVMLNDTLIREIKHSQNDIILCGAQRGINTNNFTTIEEATVKVMHEFLEEKYKSFLLSIFSAEL